MFFRERGYQFIAQKETLNAHRGSLLFGPVVAVPEIDPTGARRRKRSSARSPCTCPDRSVKSLPPRRRPSRGKTSKGILDKRRDAATVGLPEADRVTDTVFPLSLNMRHNLSAHPCPPPPRKRTSIVASTSRIRCRRRLSVKSPGSASRCASLLGIGFQRHGRRRPHHPRERRVRRVHFRLRLTRVALRGAAMSRA